MPTLNDVLSGSLAQAVQVQQIIDAMKGTASKGVPVSFTSLNDPSNYALTVRNLDATNSRALSVLKADGTGLITADATGVTLGSPLHIPAGSIGSTEILDGSIATADIGAGQITPALLAAGAASSNIGALGGALSGTLPNPSHTYQNVSLGSPVALAATTWTTAVNLNLVAGTWLIWGVAQLIGGSSACNVQARIFDGVTVRSSGAFSNVPASGGASIALPPCVVTPGGVTTYGLQGYCSVASGQVYATSAITAEPGATQMVALRLA